MDKKIDIELKNIEDFRNYKISIEKAKIELGYSPRYSLEDTVTDVFDHLKEYGDFSNELFYNITTFKKIDIIKL